MYGDEEKANDAEKTKGEARKPYPFCSAMCVQTCALFTNTVCIVASTCAFLA